MEPIDEKWNSCLHCFYGHLRGRDSIPEECVNCDWELVNGPDGKVSGIRKTGWVSKLNLLKKAYSVDKLN